MPKKRKINKKYSIVHPILAILAIILVHFIYLLKIKDPLSTFISLIQLALIIWGIAYTTHLIKEAKLFYGVLFFLIFILLIIIWMISFLITIGI
jgi:hypothetical protein